MDVRSLVFRGRLMSEKLALEVLHRAQSETSGNTE